MSVDIITLNSNKKRFTPNYEEIHHFYFDVHQIF